MQRSRLLPLAVAAAALVAAPAAALDLHRLWDEQCAGCHGHSADFARGQLRVEGGQVQGASGRDVLAFLERHGHLSPRVAEGILAMLQAQAGRSPDFRERCATCHGTAAELARDALVVRDGMLLGRYTGRPVAEFLRGHGRLSEPEAGRFTDLLARLEREVHFE